MKTLFSYICENAPAIFKIWLYKILNVGQINFLSRPEFLWLSSLNCQYVLIYMCRSRLKLSVFWETRYWVHWYWFKSNWDNLVVKIPNNSNKTPQQVKKKLSQIQKTVFCFFFVELMQKEKFIFYIWDKMSKSTADENGKKSFTDINNGRETNQHPVSWKLGFIFFQKFWVSE